MQEEITITLNHTTYTVYIERKRIKNLYLRIGEDGTLQVHCPNRVSKKAITEFLQNNQDWIAKATAKQQKSLLKYGIDGEYYWQGKLYQSVYIPSPSPMKFMHQGDKGIFKGSGTEADMQKAFYQAARSQLQEWIRKNRSYCDQTICDPLEIPHPKITLRYTTSRWGSCTPAHQSITMSLRLIHYPEECFRYVLIHEYVHLLIPHHGKDFYAKVEEKMPDYKKWKEMLK